MKIRVKKILWGTAGTLVALFPAFLMAHYDGPDSGHTAAPVTDNAMSCAAAGCHSSALKGGPINSYGGSVTATFSSCASYKPGGPPITITVTASDPVNTHFGFQMTARVASTANGADPQQAGSFNPGPNPGTSANPIIVLCSDNNLRPANGCASNVPYEYIEHFFSDYTSVYTTSQSYTFTWTPPATNVGNVVFYVAGNVVNYNGTDDGGDHVYTASYTLTPQAAGDAPTIVTGGVLNAASFAKNSNGLGSPVAPGSLVSIFASNFATSQSDASAAPFPFALGGVCASFNGVPAAIRDVVPAANLINVQVPFETASGSVSALVTSTTGASSPQAVTIVAQAPGIFTIPPGVGNAIVVNLNDGSIAGPTNANIGLTTHPIPRGTPAFFYATGLGAVTPPETDGAADSIIHNANALPKVMIGGISAQVLFAGLAPGFPGVYQVNIIIPANAPTGNGISVQIESADGTVTSAANIATISVQ
jgi:uncharacterized protein (TIGR03437 family)